MRRLVAGGTVRGYQGCPNMHKSVQGVPQWYPIEFVQKPEGRGICGFVGNGDV